MRKLETELLASAQRDLIAKLDPGWVESESGTVEQISVKFLTVHTDR